MVARRRLPTEYPGLNNYDADLGLPDVTVFGQRARTRISPLTPEVPQRLNPVQIPLGGEPLTPQEAVRASDGGLSGMEKAAPYIGLGVGLLKAGSAAYAGYQENKRLKGEIQSAKDRIRRGNPLITEARNKAMRRNAVNVAGQRARAAGMGESTGEAEISRGLIDRNSNIVESDITGAANAQQSAFRNQQRDLVTDLSAAKGENLTRTIGGVVGGIAEGTLGLAGGLAANAATERAIATQTEEARAASEQTKFTREMAQEGLDLKREGLQQTRDIAQILEEGRNRRLGITEQGQTARQERQLASQEQQTEARIGSAEKIAEASNETRTAEGEANRDAAMQRAELQAQTRLEVANKQAEATAKRIEQSSGQKASSVFRTEVSNLNNALFVKTLTGQKQTAIWDDPDKLLTVFDDAGTRMFQAAPGSYDSPADASEELARSYNIDFQELLGGE